MLLHYVYVTSVSVLNAIKQFFNTETLQHPLQGFVL
jgi:hypothetical protein